MGTTVPGARFDLTWTTLLMRSSEPAPMCDPGKAEAPVATNTSSSMVVPFRWVCGPISTESPIVNGYWPRPRSTACSITTTSFPIVTGPRTPWRTARSSTLEPAPIVTCPLTIACGDTHASGCTSTIRPVCNVGCLTACHHPSTIVLVK